MAETKHTRRCSNAQCRVETYAASHLMPLNTCPVCLMPGAITAADTEGTD